MRVLAIGAHPDDLEILCFGTLARFTARGDEVVCCHVSDGDKGHFVITPADLGKVRVTEAANAARLIGAEASYLGFHDCEIYHNAESLGLFVDLMRHVKPEIVITHAPNDYMPDHVAVSRLACDASFHATVPHFLSSVKEHTGVLPAIYFMDNLAGIDFHPTRYIDITEMIAAKQDALRAHESQLTWLRDHDQVDIVEFMTAVARFRGLQAGVHYAEGFRQFEGWGRIRPMRELLS